MNETFLTSKELAERWKLEENTIRRWRSKGVGPDYIKLEGKKGAVRYSLKGVEDYEELWRRAGKLHFS